MKGSHTVEGFLNWLDKTDHIPLHTKLHLKKRVKEGADKASATGEQVVLPIKRNKDLVMAMRFFDDGSMEVGWPLDAKWPGKTKTPGLAPPPEKEI